MPHATIKLIPGVDTTKTPTLNEMAVSYSSLIRFMPDRTGYGLVQKIGGWTKLISGGLEAPVRALTAWSDLEYNKYLAIGGEGSVGAQVYNDTNNSSTTVTPYYFIQDEESSFTNTTVKLKSVDIHVLPVVAATTANLTATYNNGTSGVGATLTNSGAQAALVIDGVTINNSDRVLIKDQTSGLQNGVYVVTNKGSASTNWVLTRATDFDSWGTGEIEEGATFFVQKGTVSANRYYYCSNTSAVTVGTNPIKFEIGGGFSTSSGTSSITFYTTKVPTSASYAFFPTIVNVGNVNLVGPYDILTTGDGLFTFVVPESLTPIAKISSTTLTGSSRKVTITFSQAHTFYAGQDIYVSGVTDNTFNGSFTIGTNSGDVTTYTISYTQTGVSTAASSNGGTVNPRVNFGGSPPQFTAVKDSSSVIVTLINHGFNVGDTFNVTIPTTLGGVTLSGLYTVNKVNSPSIGNFSGVFEISAGRLASSNKTEYENLGNIYAKYFYALVQSSQGANYFYGAGIYNEGVYNSGFVPSAVSGKPIISADWTFDNWGSILVACPKNDAIYYWQPVGSAIQNLSYMPNAPVYNSGVFVAMPQRQVIAYGSSFGTIQDPLLVRWCDLEDFTTWVAQANNQAGSYRIPTGSRIVGAIQASQQALIWTDLDVWSMTYIGQPYIYGFNKIGANAGLIAQKAAGQMGGIVYWMGQKQFFKFSGAGVEVIPCPVWDKIFQNLYSGTDENGNLYIDRIRCATNSQFNEVTWYFPAKYTADISPNSDLSVGNLSAGNGEVNAYVKYNVALNQWDYGYQKADDSNVLVGRTAWIDQSVLGPPIGAASSSSVNISNGVPIDGYFTGTSIYASGITGFATIFFNPVNKTFATGSSVTLSGFTDTKFNGVFTVAASTVGNSASVSVTSASPAVITWVDHNLSSGFPVYLTSTGSMPTGITQNQLYFVKTVLSSSTFTISSTVGGAEINTSSTGSGVIKCFKPSTIFVENSKFISATATDTSSGVIRYEVTAPIYQHEVTNNAANSPIDCGFTTGYASISDGDKMTFIDQVWPDMKWGQMDQFKTADVKITFYVTNYPGDPPIVHGPYDVNKDTEYLSVRMRGRLVSISVSSSDLNSFWRIGAIRYRFQEDGKY